MIRDRYRLPWWRATRRTALVVLLAGMIVWMGGCDKVKKAVEKATKKEPEPVRQAPVAQPEPKPRPRVEAPPPPPPPPPKVPLEEMKTRNPRAQVVLKRALELRDAVGKAESDTVQLVESMNERSWQKAMRSFDEWSADERLMRLCVRVLELLEEPAASELKAYLNTRGEEARRQCEGRLREVISDKVLRKKLSRRARRTNERALEKAQKDVEKALKSGKGLEALPVLRKFVLTPTSGMPWGPFYWKMMNSRHIQSLHETRTRVTSRFRGVWSTQFAATLREAQD